MLRSCHVRPKGIWTYEEIKEGFEEFFKEFNRYPTALEIDAYEYLPSSRSLQRTFGGLVQVRKKLFPDQIHDYTTGEHRSKVASNNFKRAQDYEEAFYDRLAQNFKPLAVHEHKVMRPGRIACDFFLYTNDIEGVCIDLFYAKDAFSLAGVINNKIRRYSVLRCPIIFILLHDGSLSSSILNAQLKNKKLQIPDNITIMNSDTFWEEHVYELKDHSIFSI